MYKEPLKYILGAISFHFIFTFLPMCEIDAIGDL